MSGVQVDENIGKIVTPTSERNRSPVSADPPEARSSPHTAHAFALWCMQAVSCQLHRSIERMLVCCGQLSSTLRVGHSDFDCIGRCRMP